MREDKLFGNYFRRALTAERLPPNPWRSRPSASSGPAKRPDVFSILSYATAILCIVACLAIQASGWYRDGAAVAASYWVSHYQVREHIQQFLELCAAYFPHGLI